jgi:lysophospholipase L1-like esterase
MVPHDGPPYSPRIAPGQTLIFLGDHTSPDEPGYVAVLSEVVGRFHPELGLRLISAGSRGQSAAGLGSPRLMELLSSARPDWLIIGIGLADALHEPAALQLLEDAARAQQEASQAGLDATFGRELRPEAGSRAPANDLTLDRLEDFARSLAAAVSRLQEAGVRVCLLTTIVLDSRTEHPVNRILTAYNRAIRKQAGESGALLVDVDRAFRSVLDRAATYKQEVTLTGPGGTLNSQGQALIARTVLVALGLLPSGRGR